MFFMTDVKRQKNKMMIMQNCSTQERWTFLIFPVIFLLILWLVLYLQYIYKLNFYEYGIYPLKIKGMIGILTAPLIHTDIKHLATNSFPLFLLLLCIFYFYREIAFKMFFLIYIISGFWVWVFARDAYHIGASGLIYGFGAFLFFSGLLRRDSKLMAISLLITFLYGGLIWGVFPFKNQISWESHLMGAVAGFVIAVFYRKIGPQRKEYIWVDEDNEEQESDDEQYKNDNNKINQ